MILKKVAIFASGGGSNAKQIIEYFAKHVSIEIALVASNRSKAGVLHIAENENIPTLVISKTVFFESDFVLDYLKEKQIDYIVLAGFLWLVPTNLIAFYKDRILNIHPSLLPKYGGKGMYGHFVHEAVHTNRESESGMSIHLVNEHFDDGQILFQASCPITSEMSPDDIAAAVLKLEHQYYSPVIEKYILSQLVSC